MRVDDRRGALVRADLGAQPLGELLERLAALLEAVHAVRARRPTRARSRRSGSPPRASRCRRSITATSSSVSVKPRSSRSREPDAGGARSQAVRASRSACGSATLACVLVGPSSSGRSALGLLCSCEPPGRRRRCRRRTCRTRRRASRSRWRVVDVGEPRAGAARRVRRRLERTSCRRSRSASRRQRRPRLERHDHGPFGDRCGIPLPASPARREQDAGSCTVTDVVPPGVSVGDMAGPSSSV